MLHVAKHGARHFIQERGRIFKLLPIVGLLLGWSAHAPCGQAWRPPLYPRAGS
jgi:hypothetical protein